MKLSRLLRFIFPERCNICRDVTQLGNYPICKPCKKKISNSYTQRDNSEKVFFLGSAVEFNKTTKELIHKLKYGRKEILARIIGREIFNKVLLQTNVDIDVVIPVPIHTKRKLWRGFNQTDLIAYEISKLLKCKCDTSNLVRNKDTNTQTKLNRSDRRSNVENVFELLNPIIFKSKNILIVDDVITTGATIESCRDVLMALGAKNVYTASFARA